MISIVVPVYNEEKYIENCIKSLFNQDYPLDDMEWIFVDGQSTDNTRMIIELYQKKYPKLIKLFDNPNRTVPYAMNIGIKKSKGEYIIRLDAHSEYSNNYFSKCVDYLSRYDIDNVGGVAETKSKTRTGETIAKMLSTKFGVGNSHFRTNGKSGYVDTVPFGAFKREVFAKYGGYDERLDRNQDNELNYRIRKNGGKVYLASDIHLSYYCRDSIASISKMAWINGKWNMITMRLCPGSMRLRHFIPFFFVFSLILFGLGGIFFKPIWIMLGIELLTYLFFDCFFSMKISTRIKEFLLLIILYPLFHFNYGIGSLYGILALFKKKYRKQGYVAPRI